MFRKLRLRLTILCAGITAIIMTVMSLSYLYVSETNLYENHFTAFCRTIDTITASLEQQSVVTRSWLSKLEAQNGYTLYLLDNGHLFLYNDNKLDNTDTASGRPALLEEVLRQDAENTSSGIPGRESTSTKASRSNYISYHTEYKFTSESRQKDFFCSIINMERESSLFQMIVLSPIDSLEEQIQDQRLLFFAIILFTVFLLTMFSWFFTGKLLKPIIENQKKQTQFVASASHELRTPLAVILSNAECCKDCSAKKRDSYLQNIKNEGARMARLIDDMLTLSASDSHGISLKKEPSELDTLMLNILEAFEPLAREKTIRLTIHLPEEKVPPCSCDPERIGQLLSILLHNAISYTPQHGAVTLFLSVKRDCFCIQVEDNGIGISDADKKKIFNRFYRAEKSRSTKGHFGLGLSIAYEIVKLHHGKISVSDGKDGGTRFTVELPLSHPYKQTT